MKYMLVLHTDGELLPPDDDHVWRIESVTGASKPASRGFWLCDDEGDPLPAAWVLWVGARKAAAS